jgi:glycosyltransferase involved in cell wall biosynthesis
MTITQDELRLPVHKYAISIIIPVYNAEDFIEATLNSILAQNFTDYEVLLIDDCSTDASKDKITPFLCDNIHYFSEDVNAGGPSKPRNTGIKRSQGQYVMFFDSDDLMLPNKLEITFKALEKHKSVGLLCTNFQSIDIYSNIINSDFLAEYRSFRVDLTHEHDEIYKLCCRSAYASLLEANFIGTSSVTVPKQVLDEIGGFYEPLTNGDDLDMWFRIAKQFDILFVDHPLHQYRVQPNSISFRGGNKNSLNRIYVLKKQLELEQSDTNISSLNYWLSINYSQAGVVELRNGCCSQARKYFIKAMRYQFKVTTLKYYIASFLNQKLISFIKKIK